MATWTPDHTAGVGPRTTKRDQHHNAASGSVRYGIDGLPVPRLRGRFHQIAVTPIAVGGIALLYFDDSLLTRSALGVFTLSVVAMLTASTVYHCHVRTPDARLRARRVDHGTIFVAIAGTQTAYWLLVSPGSVAVPVIAGVWVVAGLGFRHKVLNLSTVDSTGNWLFGALGWSGVALLPWLVGHGLGVLALVTVGGLAYSVGGVMLHRRWGNPWPGVIGHHEVWHALVLVGVVLHGAGITLLTRSVS